MFPVSIGITSNVTEVSKVLRDLTGALGCTGYVDAVSRKVKVMDSVKLIDLKDG